MPNLPDGGGVLAGSCTVEYRYSDDLSAKGEYDWMRGGESEEQRGC